MPDYETTDSVDADDPHGVDAQRHEIEELQAEVDRLCLLLLLAIAVALIWDLAT